MVYSLAAGDAVDGLSDASSPFIYLHPSIQPPGTAACNIYLTDPTAANQSCDAQLKADGTPDNRYTAKVTTFLKADGTPNCIGTGSAVPGICTTQNNKIYGNQTDPIPIMTTEELLLIRSEAEWFTGAKAAAIADLNTVRTTSGGLPPSTLTVASSDSSYVTALLYERRYSLLLQGHRWVDLRRFGRLNSVTIDIPPGKLAGYAGQGVYNDLIIPQTECQIRASLTKPPTCP